MISGLLEPLTHRLRLVNCDASNRTLRASIRLPNRKGGESLAPDYRNLIWRDMKRESRCKPLWSGLFRRLWIRHKTEAIRLPVISFLVFLIHADSLYFFLSLLISFSRAEFFGIQILGRSNNICMENSKGGDWSETWSLLFFCRKYLKKFFLKMFSRCIFSGSIRQSAQRFYSLQDQK